MKKNKEKVSQNESKQECNINNNNIENQEFESESNWSESVNDFDTDSGFKDETDSLESKSDTDCDDMDQGKHFRYKDALRTAKHAANCGKVWKAKKNLFLKDYYVLKKLKFLGGQKFR